LIARFETLDAGGYEEYLYLLGLQSYTENGGSTLFPKVGKTLPDYTASYPK
jgi:hypothetical protein